MRILAMMGLLAFVLSWQHFALACAFLLAPFFALYRENFIIFWARKNIIKKATLYKNAFFYRLTRKNTLLAALCALIALLGTASLGLNLMYASWLDLAFLFLLFPLFFVALRQILSTQFRKNPYNTLRVIAASALFTALFYALAKAIFAEKMDAFFYINNFIDTYKVSIFAPLDTLSQALHFLIVLKNFTLFWLDNFAASCIVFCFEFVNFFVLCASFALLCSYTLRGGANLLASLFLGALTLLFYDESLSIKPKYQDRVSTLLANLEQPLTELNLTSIAAQNELYREQIAKIKALLDKNALEIGIWWLSGEKDELKKSLQRGLP